MCNDWPFFTCALNCLCSDKIINTLTCVWMCACVRVSTRTCVRVCVCACVCLSVCVSQWKESPRRMASTRNDTSDTCVCVCALVNLGVLLTCILFVCVQRNNIACVSVSGDGRWLATADVGVDSTIVMWDTRSRWGVAWVLMYTWRRGSGCEYTLLPCGTLDQGEVWTEFWCTHGGVGLGVSTHYCHVGHLVKVRCGLSSDVHMEAWVWVWVDTIAMCDTWSRWSVDWVLMYTWRRGSGCEYTLSPCGTLGQGEVWPELWCTHRGVP